jgi:hypothetical protein
MHHSLGRTSCYTHQTSDAELLIEHYNALVIDTKGLGGADLYAGLALVTDFHLGRAKAFIDPDTGFLSLVYLEIEI